MVQVELLASQHGEAAVMAELADRFGDERLADALVFCAVTAIGCARHRRLTSLPAVVHACQVTVCLWVGLSACALGGVRPTLCAL